MLQEDAQLSILLYLARKPYRYGISVVNEQGLSRTEREGKCEQ